jgi:hypothetical protein
VQFTPPDGRDDPRTAVPLPGYRLRPIEPRMDLVADERRRQLAEAQRRFRARQKAARG